MSRRSTWILACLFGAVLLLPAGCTSSRLSTGPVAFVPRLAEAGDTTPAEASLEIRQNIPFVEVMLNDQGPYLFALDTGANVTVVSEALAFHLNTLGSAATESYPGVAKGAAGDEVALKGILHIESLELGEATFSDFHAAVINMRPVREALGSDVMGIVGFSLFADRLMTIDYPRQRMMIESGDLPVPDQRDVLALRIDDGLPVLPVTFGGVQIPLVIDTGSDHSFALPTAAADRLAFEQAPTPGPMAATIGGVSQRMVGQLASTAEVGAYRVHQPDVMVTAGRARMGGEVLRNFVVTFDQRRGAVRLAGAFEPQDASGAGVLTSVDIADD